MLIEVIIPIILFTLIVIFDAAKDVLESRFAGSFFDKHPELFPKEWFGPYSWKNKWVLDENDNPKLDEYGERIPKKWFGLIDIPDAFTDGWHLIKFFLWTALITITAINLPLFGFLLNFVILSAIYLFLWWIFYNKIFLYGKQ